MEHTEETTLNQAHRGRGEQAGRCTTTRLRNIAAHFDNIYFYGLYFDSRKEEILVKKDLRFFLFNSESLIQTLEVTVIHCNPHCLLILTLIWCVWGLPSPDGFPLKTQKR